MSESQPNLRFTVMLLQVLAPREWSMTDERTGKPMSGISYKADVALPGLGSFKIKLSEQQHASLSAQPFGVQLVLNMVPRVGPGDQLMLDVASAELVAADPGRKAS